ncbi:TPA: LysR family transcriptional regulator [Citrobacter koseri]|uniref:LysR family transcriptional regulator n=1 Tax=Citrobacter TaxID=544 RepID=UPI001906551D|nr:MULTISPECIES: LysR family transcriptional regulator [Citrobacter]MBJ8938763.1 LysR family transcriptional regulator [Citrobacter koseri]MDM2973204.1 LysR family transcriptional regulator [Citrobacter sp. CK198]HEI8856940.1 LysR family transcriptional regulator [Citrobacter koseri]
MDIKQLKYLIALDQTRHFGKAASQCNITQPTLSMRIRNLEEELGLVLIVRGQRFEGFTPEGERILAWAKSLLAAHDGLQAEAALCKGQVVGVLRLGMVPLASVDPMLFIRELTPKYPELQFSLYSMTSEQIAEGVNSNQLELGICYLNNIDVSPFDVIPLAKTQMGLLHDSRHFEIENESLSWNDLINFPLGFLTKGMHYREHMDMSFKSAGISPKHIFESDSTFQIIQAVQRGICCAIMPLNNGLENLNSNFHITPVVNSNIEAPVGLIMRKQAPVSSLALRCFTDARDIYAAHNPQHS